MNALFDAHVHLQDFSESLLPKVMARARSAGVTRFGCCGTHVGDWEKVRRIAVVEAGVIPSYGLHPWFVAVSGVDNWRERLEQFLFANPESGIGEIGLDGTRPHRAAQMQAFLAQLELAKMYERPVAIHCVKAAAEMIDILRKYAKHLPEMLFHSPLFSADAWKALSRFQPLVSIGPQILNPRAIRIRELARILPENRLRYETDAPGRIVSGYAIAELGGLNAPENLPHIMAKVQHLRTDSPS